MKQALNNQKLWIRLTYITSLERTIARQRSRVRWIKEGDANTKLFHAITNRRRTKNFIPALKHGEDIIMDHSRKEEVFFDMYNNLPGSIQIREHSLDLDTLGLPTHDLRELGNMISEDEVFAVIKEMPADRAPGPDGFIGVFYRRAFPVINQDTMAAILKFYTGDGRNFWCLNRALTSP